MKSQIQWVMETPLPTSHRIKISCKPQSRDVVVFDQYYSETTKNVLRQQALPIEDVIGGVWSIGRLCFDGELELGRGASPGRSHVELTMAEYRFAHPYSHELDCLSLGLVHCGDE